MEDEYNIASEIKSETKVAGKLLVSTFYFLCFYWILFYSLRVFVHTQLMLPYAIFAICTGIFFTMPSYFNRKRKMYQSILIFFFRDKSIYRPVRNVSAIKRLKTLKLTIEREEIDKY